MYSAYPYPLAAVTIAVQSPAATVAWSSGSLASTVTLRSAWATITHAAGNQGSSFDA